MSSSDSKSIPKQKGEKATSVEKKVKKEKRKGVGRIKMFKKEFCKQFSDTIQAMQTFCEKEKKELEQLKDKDYEWIFPIYKAMNKLGENIKKDLEKFDQTVKPLLSSGEKKTN